MDFIFMDWSFAAIVTQLIWLAQLLLILHVLRTGRPWWWLLVLFFAPMLGGLVYFFVEVLPGWTTREVTAGWKPKPLRLREARAQVEETGTVKAEVRLLASATLEPLPEAAFESATVQVVEAKAARLVLPHCKEVIWIEATNEMLAVAAAPFQFAVTEAA